MATNSSSGHLENALNKPSTLAGTCNFLREDADLASPCIEGRSPSSDTGASGHSRDVYGNDGGSSDEASCDSNAKRRKSMLKGVNYPLTPKGTSTLNPPPPWYYSPDFLNIEF